MGYIVRVGSFIIAAFVAGCAQVDTPVEHRAGDYQFYTLAVEDGCLDGAMEALFMPNGPEASHAFAYPVYVAGLEELPSTYPIDLREPFMGMTVTLTAGDDGTIKLRGSVMDDVSLGDIYGDCVSTMTVDADFTPLTSTELEGRAWIDISNPRGAEGLCPVFDADPCEVQLSLHGTLD